MRIANHHELLAMSRPEKAERFTEIDTLVHQEFTQLVEAGHVIGAFPFGSTQFGDHTALSDYDLVAAIEENGIGEETLAFQAIHEAAKRIYHRTSVPLEVSCYTADQLTEGLHGFPTTMLTWLKEQRRLQPEGMIGADFVPHIKPKHSRESPLTLVDIDGYVDRTRYVLKKNWWQGTYFQPHDLLGITLNIPHVMGRKTIDTLQQGHAIPKGTLKDLTKRSIREAVLNIFGAESDIGVLYSSISSDMQSYQNEFISQAAQLSTQEYDQIIEAVLEENLPKGIELLRRMQEEYRHIFNQSATLEKANTWPYVERGSNLTTEGHHDRMVREVRASQMNS